jgi:hypothetical protein
MESVATLFQSNEIDYDKFKAAFNEEGVEFGSNKNVLLSKYEARILFNSLVQNIRKTKSNNNESFKLCLTQKAHHDLDVKLVTYFPTQIVEERNDIVIESEIVLLNNDMTESVQVCNNSDSPISSTISFNTSIMETS